MNGEKLQSLPLGDIRIEDAFWGKYIRLVKDVILPYQWETLNDNVPDAEPSHCIKNFRIAAGEEKGTFQGAVFQDTDVAKWLEAAAFTLASGGRDEMLESLADETIKLIGKAQCPDGYLNTYYTIQEPDRRWSNLKEGHELYTAGHMIEAAVAYYEATGKDAFLKIVSRFADVICEKFGPDEGQCHGYPGHPEVELALVKLYRATGEKRYLEVSKYFVEQRGVGENYFFQEEKGEKYRLIFPEFKAYSPAYSQSHLPVREQKTAEGHAVRAVYLYCAMADLAYEYRDESLLDACRTLWDNMVKKRMFITGGIGSSGLLERFTTDYDLPNDTAYAETCAAIGLVFLARRMLEIKPVSQYADVMERALYNCVLSGMALDGRSFFYVNPLEVNPEACRMDERKAHVKPVRQKWFGCACCPPNLARMLSSISSYAYTETEDTLFVHLYMGSIIKKQVNGKELTITVSSKLPKSGQVEIEVSGGSVPFTIALRIPDWCGEGDTGFSIKGVRDSECTRKDGYLYVTRCWQPKERLSLKFAMDVKIMEADPRVREDIGKVAVTRGPMVYCLEEADNGTDLHLLTLDCGKEAETEEFTVAGEQVIAVVMDGFRQQVQTSRKGLYHPLKTAVKEPVKLRFIPYYVWANRGENEMTVWVRQEK